MSSRIIRSVADLPKVCEHINLPGAVGRRRRAATDAPPLLHRRNTVTSSARSATPSPTFTISTDIIVGFPGETEEQYQNTLQLVSDLRFDKVHGAAYSTRPRPPSRHAPWPTTFPRKKSDSASRAWKTLQESILDRDQLEVYGTKPCRCWRKNRKRGQLDRTHPRQQAGVF